MAQIELADFVTPAAAEAVLRWATEASKRGDMLLHARGTRAARARDPKLLLVMERVCELATKRMEDQLLQTRRGMGATVAEKAIPVEISGLQAAYQALDRSAPAGELAAYGFIYGAACRLAFGG